MPLCRSTSDARPRVLLADDHPGVLRTVSAILADDFDVVGAATDGDEALAAARQLDPDLIVLDVSMPRLDGIRTIQGLQQAGSRGQVVFLSMHDTDDYVGEAFNCGGRGYVLKTRIQRDLACALDHILAGRLFVPSLTSVGGLVNGSGHAMCLHDDGPAFINELGGFVDDALRRGDATCVVAPERVREALGERLRTQGWNIGGPSGHSRYLAMDTVDALNRFMVNGMPDADRLTEIVAELDAYRVRVGEGSPPRLTLFGDMAASLSLSGSPEAAMTLEAMWSALTSPLPFLTVCAYSVACFASDTHADFYRSACAPHSAVSNA